MAAAFAGFAERGEGNALGLTTGANDGFVERAAAEVGLTPTGAGFEAKAGPNACEEG